MGPGAWPRGMAQGHWPRDIGPSRQGAPTRRWLGRPGSVPVGAAERSPREGRPSHTPLRTAAPLLPRLSSPRGVIWGVCTCLGVSGSSVPWSAAAAGRGVGRQFVGAGPGCGTAPCLIEASCGITPWDHLVPWPTGHTSMIILLIDSISGGGGPHHCSHTAPGSLPCCGGSSGGDGPHLWLRTAPERLNATPAYIGRPCISSSCVRSQIATTTTGRN